MNLKLIYLAHNRKGRMLDARRTEGQYSFEHDRALEELLANPDVEFIRIHRVVEPTPVVEDVPPAPFEPNYEDDVPF